MESLTTYIKFVYTFVLLVEILARIWSLNISTWASTASQYLNFLWCFYIFEEFSILTSL